MMGMYKLPACEGKDRSAVHDINVESFAEIARVRQREPDPGWHRCIPY
jgi:hypothetical protein